MLKAFAYKLMDHIANDTKTPAESVMKAWTDWDSTSSSIETAREMDAQEFRDKHELPQIDRITAYEAYMQQQKALKDIYFSDSPHRINALHEWLNMTPPLLLKQGVMVDELYTAFAKQPSPLVVSYGHFKNKGHKNVE